MTKPLLPMPATLFAALLTSVSCLAQQPQAAAQATAERHPMLAFVEKFDSLDTTNLQLVRIDSLDGWVSHRFAWILEQDGERYDVRYLDLGRGTVTQSPQVRVERVHIADALQGLQEHISALNDRTHRLWFSPSPTTPMHPRTQALLLARACELCGMDVEKHKLLQMAGNQRTYQARDFRFRVVLNMADPQFSWQQLLKQRELVNQSFEMPRVGLHLGKADVFESVIKAIDDPKTCKVKRALIEDPWVDGNSKFDSGPVASPAKRPEGSKRALHKLFAEGAVIIPELIKLLDDQTATRSLNYSSKFGGVLDHNSVGDQANAVLKQIGGYVRDTHLRGKRVEAWKNWHAENRGKTLREIVEDRIVNMRRYDIECYLANWPDGIDLVLQIAEAQEKKLTQTVSLLLGDKRFQNHGRVHWLANRSYQMGMHEGWRAGFAVRMLEAGMPEALPALRKLWTRRDLTELPTPKLHYLDEAAINLRALMLHGNASDWRAIEESMTFEPVRHRCALVLLREPDLLVRAGLRNADRSEAWLAAKNALTQMLPDTAELLEQRGIATATGPVQIHSITCADAAAIALSNLHPTVFAYQPHPTSLERHRQLAELRAQIAR